MRAPRGFCLASFDHARAGRKGGLVGTGGRQNVLDNRVAGRGIFALGVQRSAARLMLHERWHVKRHRVNLACWHCRASMKGPL